MSPCGSCEEEGAPWGRDRHRGRGGADSGEVDPQLEIDWVGGRRTPRFLGGNKRGGQVGQEVALGEKAASGHGGETSG